jgi:hypothetical protein
MTSELAGGEWSASRPCLFTTGERAPGTHWIGGLVNPRAGLDDLEKSKFLTLPGLKLRPLNRPPRSPSQYPLNYPDLNRNICQRFLMLSASEKHFPFSTCLSSGNSRKTAGANSRERGGDATNCDTRSEEYVGALSWWRINERSLHNSPRLRHTASTQHLHIECLINSGPFGYKFKWTILLIS